MLLGFSFLGITAQSVKADTVNPVEKDRQEIVNKDQTSKTVGGGVLHSPSTEAVGKTITASSNDKTADTATKKNKETNSTSVSNTGAISGSNEKPNLSTFPGLTLFFQANKTDNNSDIVEQSSSVNNNQTAAEQNSTSQSEQNQANERNAQSTDNTVTNSSTQNNKETNSVANNKQASSTDKKQLTKPDLSTFPGLSMFFTDVKNVDVKDNAAKTPAQDTNADKSNQDQTNAESKTPSASLVPAEKTPTAPKKDAALTAAASDLQSAIEKGDTYVNSDKFNQMTAEKQKQLRDAIQTGKELMAKYNTMQAAMNSAALKVDQNNKAKAKANDNTPALTALSVNDNTPVDTNVSVGNATTDTNSKSDNEQITAPELSQAAQNIIVLLPALNPEPSGVANIGANDWDRFLFVLADDKTATINLTDNLTAPDNSAGTIPVNSTYTAGTDPSGTQMHLSFIKTINGNGHNLKLNNYTFTDGHPSYMMGWGPSSIGFSDINIDGSNTVKPTFDRYFTNVTLNNAHTTGAINFSGLDSSGACGVSLVGNSSIDFETPHTTGSNALFDSPVSIGSYSESGIVNPQTNVSIKVGQQIDRLFAPVKSTDFNKEPQINLLDNVGGCDVIDNASNRDLTALKISMSSVPLIFSIISTNQTVDTKWFMWGGKTNFTSKIPFAMQYVQAYPSNKYFMWLLNPVTNINLADTSNTDPSNVNNVSLISGSEQETPKDEILSKDYTNRTFNISVDQLNDKSALVNYDYSNKFDYLMFRRAETDAGGYDVTAADQKVHKGDVNPPDPNDASDKAILTFKDNTITDGDQKQNIATLKDTADLFRPNNKTIQTIDWEPNAIMDADGVVKTDSALSFINSDKKLNTSAGPIGDNMSNAVIKITYGDGTTDEVPVKFSIQTNADLYKNAKPTITTHQVKDALTSDTEAINKSDLTSLIDTDGTDVKDKVDSVKWDTSTGLPNLSSTAPTSTKLIVHFTGDPATTFCTYPADQVTITTQPVVAAQDKIHTRVGVLPSTDDAKKALDSTDVGKLTKWNPAFKWVNYTTGKDLTADDVNAATSTAGKEVGIRIDYYTDSKQSDGYQIVPVNLVVDNDATYYSDIDSVDLTVHENDLWPPRDTPDTAEALSSLNGQVTAAHSTSHGKIDTSIIGYQNVKYQWRGTSWPDLTGTTANVPIVLYFADGSVSATIPADKVHITVKSAKASDKIQTIRTNSLPTLDQAKAAVDLTDVTAFNPEITGTLPWAIKDANTHEYRTITKADTLYDKADANGQITAYTFVNYTDTAPIENQSNDGGQYVKVKLNLTPNSASYDDDPVATSIVTHVNTKATNFQDTLNKHVQVETKADSKKETVDQITDPTKAKVVFLDADGKVSDTAGPDLTTASDKTTYQAKIDYGDGSYSNAFGIDITVEGASEKTPIQNVIVGEQPKAAQAKDAVKVDTTNMPNYKAEWYTGDSDGDAWDPTNNPFNTADVNANLPAWVKVSYYTGSDKTAAEADGSEIVAVHLNVESHADAYKDAKPIITTHKVTADAVANANEAISLADLDSLNLGDEKLKDKVDSISWVDGSLPNLSKSPVSDQVKVHFTGDPAATYHVYDASQVTINLTDVKANATKVHTVVQTMPNDDPSAAATEANAPVKALDSTDVGKLTNWYPKFSWVKADGSALSTDDLKTPTSDGLKVGIKINYYTDQGQTISDGSEIVPVYLIIDSKGDQYKDAQATITTHQVTGDLNSANEAINLKDLKLVNGTGPDSDITDDVDAVKWDSSSYPTLSETPAGAKIIVHFKKDPAGVDHTYPASQVTITTQKVEADSDNIQKTDPSTSPDATQAEAALKKVDTDALKKWNPVYSWASDDNGTALKTSDIATPTGKDGQVEYVVIKYYTDPQHTESNFDGQQIVKVNLIVNNFADAYKNATAIINTHKVTGALTAANEAINLKDLKLTNGTGPDADITNDVDSVEWADTPDLSGANGLTVHAKIKVHFKNDPDAAYATYDTDHVTINLADVKAGAKIHTALKTLPNNDSSATATAATAAVQALNSTDVGNLKDWHPQFSWVKTNGGTLTSDDLSTVTPSGSDGTAVGIKISYYTDSDHTKPDGYEIVPVKLIVDSDADTYKNATAVITTHKVDGTLNNANQAISTGDLNLTAADGSDISGEVDSVKWAGTLPDLSGTNTASAEIEVHFKDDPSGTTQTYTAEHVTIKLVDVTADDNNKQNVDVKSLPTSDQAQAALLKDDVANISKWNPVFSWTKDKQGTALTADDVKTATGASGQPEYVLIKYYTDPSHSEASFDGEEYVPVMLRVGYKAPKPNNGNHIPEPDRTPKLPIPGEVDIPQGTDLSGDTTYAGDAIKNKDQLPDGTKYSWQPAPDTSKKGKQEGTVVVTYPDGTKTSINVTVNIVDKNANGTSNGNNGNNHGEAKEELLKHNAYLYGQDGKRANKAVLKAGSTVTTYGMVVINGRKFFTLDNDYYLAAGNAVAQTRKLKYMPISITSMVNVLVRRSLRLVRM
ncbi:hypothetical protein HG715_06545 [Lactobacillus acetotolerans]|nr:Rib/alpha-like domain-containing protein [Lactobacillus acetotolerans]QJD73586.1 hypothetical protein HG715_06545 [Lactobacillus acetotolerans]